jgi:hypothetical protein
MSLHHFLTLLSLSLEYLISLYAFQSLRFEVYKIIILLQEHILHHVALEEPAAFIFMVEE